MCYIFPTYFDGGEGGGDAHLGSILSLIKQPLFSSQMSISSATNGPFNEIKRSFRYSTLLTLQGFDCYNSPHSPLRARLRKSKVETVSIYSSEKWTRHLIQNWRAIPWKLIMGLMNDQCRYGKSISGNQKGPRWITSAEIENHSLNRKWAIQKWKVTILVIQGSPESLEI